ncbi:hypothetical protein K9L05_00890 [Candidatus Babeliales bacterium]|nr:hypothetical protein [Candidatus Babeliales bacterium]
MIRLLKFKKIFLLILLFFSTFVAKAMLDEIDKTSAIKIKNYYSSLPPQMPAYNIKDRAVNRMATICYWAKVLNEKVSRIFFTFAQHYIDDHASKIYLNNAGILHFQISKHFLLLEGLFKNNDQQKNVEFLAITNCIERLIFDIATIDVHNNFKQIFSSIISEREEILKQKLVYNILGPPLICPLLRSQAPRLFDAAKYTNNKIFEILKKYYCRNFLQATALRWAEKSKENAYFSLCCSHEKGEIFPEICFCGQTTSSDRPHPCLFYPSNLQDLYLFDIEYFINAIFLEEQIYINTFQKITTKKALKIEKQKTIKYYQQALKLNAINREMELRTKQEKKLHKIDTELSKQHNIAIKSALQEARQEKKERFARAREDLENTRSEILSDEYNRLKTEQEKILALEKQRLLAEQEKNLREQQEQRNFEDVRMDVEDLSIQESEISAIENQSEDFVLINNIFGQIYKTNKEIVKLINQAKKCLAHDSSLIVLLTKMQADNNNLTSNRSLENGFKKCIVNTDSLKFFTYMLRVISSSDSNALRCKNESRSEQIEFLNFFKENIIQKCGHSWLVNYTNFRNELINLGKELLEAIKNKLPPDYDSVLIMNNFERTQTNLFDLLQVSTPAPSARTWCTIS